MSERKIEKTRKEFIGIVKSDKMQKTVVVEVETFVRHPRYGKTIKAKEKFKAHDEKNEAHIGDKVRICETRPLSKDKRWRVVEILARAAMVGEIL
ncbi:MAG: 30S ribosomal protein S17 [Candidatus Omnitrophica bacterium]|nr:30S ribosomal protein S17 [Candidatus Omnitrophota bacterium]MDD5574305.1 30S ribosomal protein S17 [Candidatus Omnitrophota bacterium]